MAFHMKQFNCCFLVIVRWLAIIGLFPAAALASQMNLQSGIVSYTLNPKTETVRMYWRQADGKPYRSINYLLESIGKDKQINAVMNGGIYSTEYKPNGLYIENGKTLSKLNRQKGKGNFFIRPGGVFSVRGDKMQIDTLETFRPSSSIDFAVQSGPILIRNGVINKRFTLASESKKIRNGIGITTDGQVIFLLSTEPMNFYQFAQEAKETLKISELLYLDGSISKMYTPSRPVYHQYYPFVTMITIEAKAQ